MKTLMTLTMGLILLLIGCNNKNSTSSGTYANGTYYWNNGSCFSSATGQVVATTLCNSTCTTTTNTGYYWNGGICYSSTTGQQVTSTLCPSTTATTNGYYLNGNICYSSATGQQVATTYCTSTCNNGVTGSYYWNGGVCYSNLGQVMDSSYCLNNNNLGTISTQCVGAYLYNNAGYEQSVNCYGTICRGYTLIEPTTRRTVICQ